MMEENGTNGEVDYGPKDLKDASLQQALTPNGDVNHDPVQETKGPSLQQSLATRKVIQLKLDNPFIKNGDLEDDADDPFCIKPSVNNYKLTQEETQEGQDTEAAIEDPSSLNQDDEAPIEDPSSLDEVDNVSSGVVNSMVIKSENLLNKTVSSNESSLDSFMSKEKFLPIDESNVVTSSEDKNSDTDETGRGLESDQTNIGDSEEKRPEDSSLTKERLNLTIEKNISSVNEKSRNLENISVEEDRELAKLPTQLDVETEKYLLFSDSKDSSDVGTSLSRSDQVELNDSVNSVSEDKVELNDSVISVSEDKVELNDSVISVSEDKVELDDSVISVSEDKVELDDSVISVSEDKVELDDSVISVSEDKMELNDSVISVSEDNSSFIESNVSDPVPEFLASAGEEEPGSKDQNADVEEKVKSVEKISEEGDGKKEEKEKREKEEKEIQMEDDTVVKQPESSVKEDNSEKTELDTNEVIENKTDKSQNNNAASEDSSTVEEKSNEAVDKVKDIDGSDILITINEDCDRDEDVSKDKRSSVKPEPVQQIPKVTSTVKDDVVIVDLSDDKPLPPVQNKPPVMPFKPGMITVAPNGQRYIQHVIQCLDGRKQIIQVPVTSGSSTSFSKGPGPYTSLLNKAIANTHPAGVTKQPEASIHPDDLIPQSSWELLALVQYEASQKKFDNTFWNGNCPVKSDISSMTKFLQDLGGDIVKQSAYSQIVEVQGRKSDQGKLGDKEKENLERMKKVVKELKEKYKHLELQTEKCAGCNFVSESKNVMAFHKEHPHMSPPLDPFGVLHCPQDACDFSTFASPEAFAEHMEKKHSVKARIYDKPDPFKCHLCYFEAKVKNNLTRHRFKCDKQFKLNQNLHPNYTDINYCLKNVMYKSQIEAKKARANPAPVPQVIKQQIKPPLIRPKIVMTKPSAPIMLQQGPSNAQVPYMIPLSQAQISQLNLTRAVRPVTNPMLVSMGTSTVTKQPPQTVGAMLKQQQGVNRPVVAKPSVLPGQQAGFEVCEICGGYVKDRMSLQIHFFYAHKVDLPAVLFQKNSPQFRCNVCQAPFWTAMGLAKHRQSSRHFDTVIHAPRTEIRCWICFQQPENLYSHLQTVHHLTTNECMILRRCMFCAIQTRSRKDLEMHMATAHGIVIKGAPTAVSSNSAQPIKPQGARNNFCVFCSKQFPDNTQLTLHCLRDHATCSGCGMVVSRAADLAKHVCKSAGRKCPVCGLKNLKQAFYNKHIRTHVKRCSVKIKRLTEKEIEVAMGKERKAKMDLEKQREIFTKLESEIWDEIQSRRKRDDADSTKKRKSNESDKSASKKAKLDAEEVVVVE
ncbi:MOG interacting and ectopic P-granules protein 1-like [Saccostrea echinata]|uniref:MOG interacting and ectopic P-granules protein 1-like n=1 Tax=Saccostrea echinata TaxID=191078 RepID=UPI002A7EEACC|nr:MOG interacting and ectopic P-granules protein 1-like [Saccostrea echinata]